MEIRDPFKLKHEAAEEGYEYFHRNIRPLSCLPNGKVDPKAKGLEDNDVDAFRHAYVSGVFTQIYGAPTADTFGRLNEHDPLNLYSNASNPGAKNMDLWNNAIGRKYGEKTRTRKTLLKKIHDALKKGELITDPEDSRQYRGARGPGANASKPVVVLREGPTGRNKLFYDKVRRVLFTPDEFIAAIEGGEYPGYTVRMVRGKPTPVSRPDGRTTNNLA